MSQQWNPLQDLMVLQDRMNRLFEDATQRRNQADGSAGDEFERQRVRERSRAPVSDGI